MSSCFERRSPLWIAGVTLALAASPAGAEWFQLSQGQAFSDVGNHRVSPDGRWAVYTQDAETDEAIELWSVRLPSGPPVRLSGALPVNSAEVHFVISPDSSRVVYTAEQDSVGVREAYSVPIGGPAAAGVKLNKTLVAGGNVVKAEPDPGGARVVYLADQQTVGVVELYSVPIAGPASAGVKLNSALVAGGDALDYLISPDGTRVVYHADQQTDGVAELYSVPIAGPASAGVKLNGALVAGGHVLFTRVISPDSARVVYLADQQTNDVYEVYSVPIAGPASAGVKLNRTLVAGGGVDPSSLLISPDSTRVVYGADQQTVGVAELYSVPIAGPASAGVKLNRTLVAGGDVWYYWPISPDSARVVYRADQQTDGVDELYSVPIAGPAVAGFKLNGALVNGGDVSDFAISPDSTWAVYAADQEFDGWPTGHRAPLGGPAGSDELIWFSAFRDPPFFSILPDSSTVVVLGNHAFVDGIVRIWTYPLTGAPDPEGTDWLGGQIQPNGDCLGFLPLPDGSGVLYRADQEIDERYELYLLYFRIWGDGFETGNTGRWSATVP